MHQKHFWKWHYTYLIIIFVIISITNIICLSRAEINAGVFQNVSFAATISSIILAILSIIISLNASNRTSGNLGQMQTIERKLNQSISHLKSIHSTTTDLKDAVRSIQNDIIPHTITEDSKSVLKKGYMFFTLGPGIKTIKSPDKKELYTLESEAIKKVVSELKLTNVQNDISLKNSPGFLFDASAIKDGVSYLIEVKFASDPKIIDTILARVTDKIERALSGYEKSHLIVVVVFIIQDNNKDAIDMSRLQDLTTHSNINFNMMCLFYNENEIKRE